MYNDEVFDSLHSLCCDSDLIGFSLMTNYFLKVKDLTIKLKEKLAVPIIWGGIHPTVKPEECLEYADMICLGEGEEAMLELADNIESGEIAEIKNLWLKSDGGIIKNELRQLEEDLDRYPFQDYDISTHYILKGSKIVKMTESVLQQSMPADDTFGKRKVQFHMISVRGCPHHCTYCCNDALRKRYRNRGKYVRKRSTQNLIRELEVITGRFGFIQQIAIIDDTFFVRTREEIKEFSSLYRRKINLPMRCNVSPQTVDEEKIKAMVDAGLTSVSIGIQSCDTHTLFDVYKRPTSAAMIKEKVLILDKFRAAIPRPVYHIIADNPFETGESIKRNIEFVFTLPERSLVQIYPLVFYPGTEIYERAKQSGYIKDEIKEIYLKSWRLADVQNLNFLTCLLYFAVWSKLSKFVMRPMEKVIRVMMKDSIVKVMDNKVMVNLLVLLLKAYIGSINLLRKLK